MTFKPTIAALAEIRAITRVDAIPSIENITLGRDAFKLDHAEECLQIALAFVDALAKMPDQAATASLVRHAVLSPGNKARALAIEKLKLRDQHDYMPLLLGGLAMPIETSFSVTTDASSNVHYTHTLYREGADTDWSYDVRKSANQLDLGGRVTWLDTYTGKKEVGERAESPIVVAAKKTMVASAAQNRYAQSAAATQTQITRANKATEELNARIVPVLAATTGKDFGDNPKAWWNWWRSQNEYYASDHPVDRRYSSESEHYYYGFPRFETYSTAPPPPTPTLHSCFAKGTLVWTKTGKKAIETIELGELVLSQDVGSGELKYKPVLLHTIRPPGKMMKISIEDESLFATTGHPFWVPGVGWRMTKELEDGTELHCVTGTAQVDGVAPAVDAPAYNLVVDKFNTYFVGERGILVHDITPRQPTHALVPGILRNSLLQNSRR